MSIGIAMLKSLKPLLLLLAAMVCLAPSMAHGYALNIEVSWNSEYGPGPYTAGNLQDGSIIQIIGYNSSGGALDPAQATNGGMTQFGQTAGGDPVLLPNTVPDGSGWEILATTTAQDTGITTVNGEWYTANITIDVPNDIDTIFVRVFYNTSFPDNGIPEHGYWGISPANRVDPTLGFALTWFDNVAITNEAYFEVIPEPSTLALLGSGLLAIAFFPRRRKLSSTSQSSTRSRE